MTSEWSSSRGEALFEAVCDLSPEERRRYLDRHCDGEPELRAEVESLLRHDARDDDFLDSPVPSPVGRHEAVDLSGEEVGPYRLSRRLGAGGFGEVYLADQRWPVERQVAIKLIKPGMDSRQVLARFEAERQALARMDHPGIARVFDAGTTPSGRPYFVMESIDGSPITEFCDERCLGLRARLELFDLVCRAIQHAHQKGVIHRDIKPSNVLVAERDGEPVPVVIDFGIAKALDRPLTDSTQMTELGQFLGTPEYISPEQADAGERDIDTRSDVYSLGVLLYQLLTGTTPFDRRRVVRFALDEVRRVILDEQPPKPSTRIGTDDVDLTAVAAARSAAPETLIRAVRGDLDWIVMKCLEKDPTRRYESPSALADDLARHLRSQPVIAGPPSFRYRAGKFLRRHRIAASTSIAVLVAVVTGVVLAVHGTFVASSERDHAMRQERKAEAIRTYFVDRMMEAANAFLGGSPETPVREVMERASAEIDGAFPDDPEIRASIQETMARTFQIMGLYQRAERQADLGLEALGEAGAHGDLEYALRVVRIDAIRTSGRLAEAEELGRTLVEDLRAEASPDPELLHKAESLLGLTLWRRGRYDEAMAVAVPLVERLTSTDGAAAKPTLSARNLVAMILRGQGENLRAIELYRGIEADSIATYGPDHPFTLLVRNNLGVALGKAGEAEEAERIAREVWMKRRTVLGETHPHTLATLANLARSFHVRGAFAEAEALTREAYQYQLAALGPTHFEVLRTQRELAESIRRQGRLDEAKTILTECLEQTRQQLGDHPDTIACLDKLGHLALQQEDFAAAAELFGEGVDRCLRVYGERDHVDTRGHESGLVEALGELGRTEELHRFRVDQIARKERIAAVEPTPPLLDWIAQYRIEAEFEDLRDVESSLAWAQRAVESTKHEDAYCLFTWARALRANDRPEDALDAVRGAIEIMPPDDGLGRAVTAFLDELESTGGSITPAIGPMRDEVRSRVTGARSDH
ncbi:MAG: tetratricopeptide repeat protein [Planctomycetes bacterium]|nr:tetratricopeptide repeat protein [Planctomycetota bacterium]